MLKFWNAYKSIVQKHCISSEIPRTSVRFWKDRLFAASVIYFIPLCLLALIPSIYLSITLDVPGILISDFVAIGIILGVAFLPGFSVYVRKILFSGSLYFISVVLFFYLGTDGPGMLYLLAITVFVVLSMDTVYGYIVLVLNVLICLIFGVFIYFELIDNVIFTKFQLDTWIGVSTNLIFLSGTAILLIPHLFKGLQTSFDEQNVLKEKLQQSIDTIQHSEQRFKALVQDGYDMIAILDEHSDFTYVAPTVKSVLGVQPESYIGTNAFDYIHPKDHELVATALNELAHDEHVKLSPFRFRNSEGNWQWIETTITNMLRNPAVGGFVANSQDLTDQIAYQKKLEESLKEKETLLAEIHHRVKNNLAIVTSLMELQAMRSDKKELQELLRLAQRRIQTIATIHELLYSAESLSYINFGENITQLVDNIERMYSGGKHITTTVDLEDVPMNIHQAIPCALMINEVITNVYKHAFTQTDHGHLEVSLREIDENVEIIVKDNGVGLADNFLDESSSSIGMTIIHSLKEQLEAELSFSNKDGTHFELTFKKSDVKNI